jgi:drug/metabolite transporter (DMT)-like permease
MSQDIAYAIAALVCYGIGDFIFKRAAAAGFSAEHFLMGQAWFFCPGVLAYGLATGNVHFVGAALWGSLAGLVILVGFVNYVRALRLGSVSVVAPIFRLNFIVTAGLAMGLLGEAVTVAKLAGFALALCAGWLLLGGAAAPGASDPAAARRALMQVIVATIAMGTASFCHKLGLIGGASPETVLAAQAVVYSTLITGFGAVRTGSFRLPAGVFRHSAGSAIVLLGAFLFMLHALRYGDASVIVPITQMGFGVAAVLGVLVFNESVTPRKLAGLGVAAMALLVLAVG